MANIGTIEGILRLRDELTPVLAKAGQQMEQAGQKIQRAGFAMTKAFTVPISIIGGASVKAFADFDAAMTESLAIMGDVSAEMRGEMVKTAREVAKTLEPSAKEAAESYFFLASAGLNAAQSIEALPLVAKFAQAGQFDMARATDLLTDAQSALGLTIRDDVVANMENMARVSDVLVRANTLANASVEQFSTALTSQAATAARAFGVSLEDTVAVLAAYADQGIKAELAGNSFARMLRLLVPAARQNAKEFDRLGVTVFDLEGNLLPMAEIVRTLSEALDGMSVSQKSAELEALGFKKRMQGVILPLLGMQEAVRGYREELDEATGFTESVAQKQLETFSKQLKLLKDRLIDVAITLGESLVPTLQNFIDKVLIPAIDKLAKMAEWFAKLPDGIQLAIISFAGLLAAIGPVLVITGIFVSSIGAIVSAIPVLLSGLGAVASTLLGPVGWVAAGVAFLLAWEPVREFLWDLIQNVVSSVVSKFREWWKETEHLRSLLASGFSAAVGAIGQLIEETIHYLTIVWNATEDWNLSLIALKSTVWLVDQSIKAVNASLEALSSWLKGNGKDLEATIKRFETLLRIAGAILPGMDEVGRRIAAAALKEELAKDKALEWSGAVRKVAEAMDKIVPPSAAGEEWQKSVDSISDYLDSLEDTEKGHKRVDEAIERTKEQLKSMVKAIDDLVDLWGGLIGAVGSAEDEFRALMNASTDDDFKRIAKAIELDLNPNLDKAAEQLNELAKSASLAWRTSADELKKYLDRLIETEEAVEKIKEAQKEMKKELLESALKASDKRVDAQFDAGFFFQQMFGIDPGQEAALLEVAGIDIVTDEYLADQAEKLDKFRRDKWEKEWEKLAGTVDDVFGPMLDSIADGLGDLVVQAIQLVEVFKSLQDQKGLGAVLGGAAFGAGVGNLLQGAGVFQGQRGAGQYGGQLSGDYGDVGSAIGGAIGAAIGTAFGATAVGAAIGAVIGGVVGGAIKSGADEGLATIKMVGDEVSTMITKDEGGLGRVLKGVGKQVVDTIEGLLDAVYAELKGLPQIQFKIRDDVISVFVNGYVQRFKDEQEAIGYAVVQALKTAEISGAGPAVQAALKDTINGVFRTIEDLAKDLEIAFEIDNLGVSDAALEVKRAIQEVANRFDEFVERASRWQLELSALVGIGQDFGAGWQGIRDQITGVVKSERAIFEQRRAIFNAQIEIEKARLLAEKSQVEAKLAIARGYAAAGEQSIAFEGIILDGLGRFVHGLGRLAQAAGIDVEELARRLAAIDAALAELDKIKPIGAGEFRPSGGIDAVAQDLERLQEILSDAATSQLTPFLQELTKINKKWDDAIALAHEDADLLSQIADARQREIDALREQRSMDFFSSLNDFVVPTEGGISTPFGDALSEIQDQAQGLRDELLQVAEDLGWSSGQIAESFSRIAFAEEDLIHLAAQDALSGLYGSLAGLIDDEGLRHDLLLAQEQIRFTLQMEQMRAEFELLKAQRQLTIEQIQLLQSAFDWIDTNVDFENLIPPVNVRNFSNATRSVSDAVDQMADRLASAKDRIRDFLLDLQTGAFGGRSSAEMFDAALAQFRQVQQQASAGNIQALEQFPDVASALLEIARERFASGEDFQRILDMVEGAGIDFLSVSRVSQDNVVFDQRFFENQMHQIQTNERGFDRMADVNHQGFAALSQDLARLNQTQTRMLDRIANLETETRLMRQNEERKTA